MKAERFLEALGEIDEKYIEEARYNTMKKRFNFKPIIAVAACAAIALAAIPVVNNFVNATPAVQGTTGAQNPPTESRFKVYEYSIADDDPGLGTHKIDSPLNKRMKYTTDISKKNTKKTVEFNGEKIDVTYVKSFIGNDYSEPLDIYEGVIDGRDIQFKIDPKTGKYTDFFLESEEILDNKRLNRDELYEIAYNFLKNSGYVDDIENYKLVHEVMNGETVGYKFRFARFIDGIETADDIRIGIRFNGEVYMTMTTDLGELKNVDVSSIDMNELYGEVEKKLKTIYGDLYEGFDKSGAVLTKLVNGSYVFDYNVDVKIKHSDAYQTTRANCLLTITID